MYRILSICIPTYNRIAELTEVVDTLLAIKSDEFEIVITDNLSTDNTREKILSYEDSRLKYYCNEKALPPFLNMIRSVFNGSGKYALYCNDRDILYSDGITKLLDVLKSQNVAFLWSPARGRRKTKGLKVYPKGYKSLLTQDSIHHPTGMVFNRELISKHLCEPDYEKYLPYINIYDFLMLDLFQFGPSVIYNGNYWGTRPVSFLKNHKSGTRLYFSPEVRETMFYGIIDHIMIDNDYDMNQKQKERVVKKIYDDFVVLFCKYKACMADPNETAHYGIDTRFVSVRELLAVFGGFFRRSLSHLARNNYEQSVIDYVSKRRLYFSAQIIYRCLKIDLINIITSVNKKGKYQRN